MNSFPLASGGREVANHSAPRRSADAGVPVIDPA